MKDERAERLVIDSHKFAYKIAGEFPGDKEEYRSIASLALVEAANRFVDVSRDTDAGWISFLERCVRNAVLNYRKKGARVEHATDEYWREVVDLRSEAPTLADVCLTYEVKFSLRRIA